MRPVAVASALFALLVAWIGLTTAPQSVPAAKPEHRTSSKPEAARPAPELIADKTRIDPVKVDPTATAEKIDRLPGLTPDQAKKTLAVLHGFEMQLVASEPGVADPVDGALR